MTISFYHSFSKKRSYDIILEKAPRKKETFRGYMRASKPLIQLIVSSFSSSPTNVFLKKRNLDCLYRVV